jgi:hypothetical protein
MRSLLGTTQKDNMLHWAIIRGLSMKHFFMTKSLRFTHVLLDYYKKAWRVEETAHHPFNIGNLSNMPKYLSLTKEDTMPYKALINYPI